MTTLKYYGQSNIFTEIPHVSVMLDEIINLSNPEKGGVFVDCTFGGGGLSKKFFNFQILR